MVLVANLLGDFFRSTGLAGSLVNGARAPVGLAKPTNGADPILPFTSFPSVDVFKDSIDFLTLSDSGEFPFKASAISIVFGYEEKE